MHLVRIVEKSYIKISTTKNDYKALHEFFQSTKMKYPTFIIDCKTVDLNRMIILITKEVNTKKFFTSKRVHLF